MIYLYALTEPDPNAVLKAVEGCEGVTGPLEATAVDAVSLLWSHCVTDEILPRRRLLLRHARILEAAMRAGPLLPMRFGMLAADFDEAREAVLAAGDRVHAEIGRLGNRAEFGVRVEIDAAAALDAVLADDPALGAERDGLSQVNNPNRQASIAFGQKLGERLGERQKAAQKALLGTLKETYDKYILKAPELDTEVLRAEFLLPPEEEEAFARAVEDAVNACPLTARAMPEIRLLGPSPAYNFVELKLDTERRGAA